MGNKRHWTVRAAKRGIKDASKFYRRYKPFIKAGAKVAKGLYRHYTKSKGKGVSYMREEAGGFRIGGNRICVRNNKPKGWQKPLVRGMPVHRYMTNVGSVLCSQTTTGYQATGQLVHLDMPFLQSCLNGYTTKAGIATLTKSQKVFLKDYTASITLTNNDLCQAEVTMYVLYPRRDTNADPVSQWSAGDIDQGGSATTYNLINATPYSSNALCTQYRIGRTRKFYLSPGGVEVVTINAKLNKMWESALYAEAPITYARGISFVTLFVARGVPYDTVAAGNAVTTSGVKIDAVEHRTLNFVVPNIVGRSYVVSDNLPHAALNTYQKINDASGAVVPDGQA